MQTKQKLVFGLIVVVLFLAGTSWANTTGTIDIDLNNVNYSFLGIGWNVHPAMFQFADWALVRENLDSMQMQFARIILHPEWWYPEENQFTPNSAAMESIYDFLDYCEENNIVVWVHNWWAGGKYDEWVEWPNHYWWLANSCRVDPTNSQNKWESTGWWGTTGPETDYPYRTDIFGYMVAKIVDYMIDTKGYTCVKYVGIWNEPSGLWAFNPRDMDGNGYPDFVYPDDFYELYDKTYFYLNSFGVLDQVKLVGCDNSVADNDSMDDFGNTMSAWSGGQRVDNYLGAMSFHSYSSLYQNVCINAKTQIYNNDYDGQYEEILVGEIGNQSFDLSTAEGRIGNSIDCAKKIVLYPKQGAYAIARWWYNGSDSGWEATHGQGEAVVPQNFNPMGLYCKSLPKESVNRYVMQTNVNASTGYFDAVNMTYWYQGGHRNTLWVVNDDMALRDVTVTFSNLDSGGTYSQRIAFEKKYVDMDNLDCPIVDGGIFFITKTNPQFIDTIPDRCIVVYRQLSDCPVGDLNDDCFVDLQDLSILILHWLEEAK